VHAAHEDAREAAGKDARFAPPEHAKKIAALEREHERVRAQKQAADDAVDRARAELRERERALREVADRIFGIHRRRQATEELARRQQSSGYDALRRAQDKRLEAYQRALARLGDEHAGLLGPEARLRVDELERGLAVADADLERHRLAVDAYDADGLKRGVAVLAVAAVALLLVLVTIARVG
jgi:hypothetical protein